MTGDMTSKTITDIITVRTASAVRGTGADITLLGIPGTSLLGDIEDGMTAGISEAGTVRITTVAFMEDGMTLGTGEVPGDGTTLGTARIIIHITADGTEDGIHTGDIITTTDTVRAISEAVLNTAGTYGTVQDIRQDQSVYSAAAHHSEEASAQEVPSAGTTAVLQAGYRLPETQHHAQALPAGQLFHRPVHLQADRRL